MNDILGPLILIGGGIATSIISLVAYWQRRHDRVGIICISAKWFIAMALGSFAIAAFYYGVLEASIDGHVFPLVQISRILWGLILTTTALMALSVLRKRNGKN